MQIVAMHVDFWASANKRNEKFIETWWYVRQKPYTKINLNFCPNMAVHSWAIEEKKINNACLYQSCNFWWLDFTMILWKTQYFGWNISLKSNWDKKLQIWFTSYVKFILSNFSECFWMPENVKNAQRIEFWVYWLWFVYCAVQMCLNDQ